MNFKYKHKRKRNRTGDIYFPQALADMEIYSEGDSDAEYKGTFTMSANFPLLL